MASGLDLRLPISLDCSDLPKERPKWKQSFLIYMHANGKINETEQSKIATFLWLVGQRGVEIFNTLFPNDGSLESIFGEFEDEEEETDQSNVVKETVDNQSKVVEETVEENSSDEKNIGRARTLKNVLKKFDENCVPERNPAMEAFKFHLITQKEKQPFAEFETALRTQMQYCEFECTSCKTSFADRMLRDRIIIGIHDKKLQLKLLESKHHPLSKIIETCKIYEAAFVNKQLLEHKDNSSLNVMAIKKDCFNCGQPFNGQHRRFCPALNVKCDLCGNVGHFKKYCQAVVNEKVKLTKGVKSISFGNHYDYEWY